MSGTICKSRGHDSNFRKSNAFTDRLAIQGPYALTITDVMKDIKLNIIDNINKNIT